MFSFLHRCYTFDFIIHLLREKDPSFSFCFNYIRYLSRVLSKPYSFVFCKSRSLHQIRIMPHCRDEDLQRATCFSSHFLSFFSPHSLQFISTHIFQSLRPFLRITTTGAPLQHVSPVGITLPFWGSGYVTSHLG